MSKQISESDIENAIKFEILDCLDATIYCCPKSPTCDMPSSVNANPWKFYPRFLLVFFVFVLCRYFSFKISFLMPFMVFHREDHFGRKKNWKLPFINVEILSLYISVAVRSWGKRKVPKFLNGSCWVQTIFYIVKQRC